MIIETFRLKGLLRFKDDVAVDLRDLPPGLIAFVGGNGEGKTTLLEAPFGALYRQLPSRSDRELLDYATERDSFVETTFAVDGQGVFRARVNLDGPKRVSDAVLEQMLPDGRPVLLSDGRVTTYDDAIAARFPAAELVLASAFAAQNRRGSFVTLGKKERRDLFAQLLGAERYEAMSATARTAASIVEQALGRLQWLREVLARESDDAIAADLDRLEDELQAKARQCEALKEEIGAEVVGREARLFMMQDAVAAYGAATQRLASLKAEEASRLSERASNADQRQKAERDHTADVQRISTKRLADLKALDARAAKAEADAHAELERLSVQFNLALKDVDERLVNNMAIQAQATEIRSAVGTVATIDHALVWLRADVEERNQAVKVIREGLTAAERAVVALITPASALTRAKADAALLATVPCGGAGVYAACGFLTNAIAATQQIPALERQLQARPAREAAVLDFKNQIAVHEDELANLKTQIAGLERDRAEHQEKANLADKLAAADARVAELASTRTRLSEDIDLDRAATEGRHRTLQQELLEQTGTIEADVAAALIAATDRRDATYSDLMERRMAIDLRVEVLTWEIATAEADLSTLTDKHERAIAVQVELKEARLAWDRVTAELATNTARLADLHRRRGEFLESVRRLVDVDVKKKQLDTELLEWQTLAKGLGREGLPTLEIDAAGPTVSGFCNDLMNVAFGPRFTLELVTEQQKRDGKGTKEVFSIQVLDNARGGEARDIADLSGGEQVIVDEALKNALCIYMNQRSAMPLRTCWRDETTGPLDAENAPRYVQMLRRVQELAGFHHILYVTHNPDAAALADAQLHVHGGCVDVLLPPFVAQDAA